MSGPLADRVAVITGASSGIGKSIAKRFSQAGCAVVLSARRKEKLQALHEELESAGAQSVVIPADVTDPEQVQSLVQESLNRFQKIDILINNAGFALEKPVHEADLNDMKAQIDSNLMGVVYGCHAVAPHMVERQDGHIINIGSICSLQPFPNYAAYVAAKFGVIGFSRSFYEEVRPHGIRVQTLCPAAVNTEWSDIAGADLPWPREERLQPEDLAEMAFFCVTQPKRVQIDTMIAWPLCEPTT